MKLPEPLGPLTAPIALVPGPASPAAQQPLPRLTVVTPSFNQAGYLETTLRSVLLQAYPNLEYFVIDGGSTDGSVRIIEHYAAQLAGWVSEKDRGQTDAIAKGLARATGDWFVWINSDDLLAPGALWAVAAAAAATRDTDLITGATCQFRDGGIHKRYAPRSITARTLVLEQLGSGVVWQQPSTWFRRAALVELGLNQASHYAFDYELMVRYTHRYPRVCYVDATLAWFRLHETSKTGSQGVKFREEQVRFLRDLSHDPGFAALRLDLDRAARAIAWAAELDALQARVGEPRLARLAQLWRGVRADPGGRCTRYSRRIARRILFTGGQRL